MSLPPIEPRNESFLKTIRAADEFIQLLKASRRLSFQEIDQIAARHATSTAGILAQAELDPDCVIDYQAAEVVCR